MNQQNKQMNAATSSEPPVKRKRGRPRKDENAPKKDNSPLPLNSPPPPPPPPHVIEQVNVHSFTNNIDKTMIGKAVTAVINGTFDAGYFLSVTIGNNNIPLHGVAFQPGRYIPVSAANDIAPQVKMYTRTELPVPPPPNATFPTASPPKTDPSPHMGETNHLQQGTPYGFGNQPATPFKNIDMMEKFEVGQSYEATKDVVSESASESMVDMLLGNGTIDEVPQGQNRDVDCGGLESNASHQIPLVNTDTVQSVESEFKLTDTVPVHIELNQTPMVSSELVHNEPKSLNLELHQTPPAEEPQSLPPNPVTEPMDIETEDPNSTQICEESETGKPVTNDDAAAAADNADYAEGGSQSRKAEFGGGESVFPEPEKSSFAGQVGDVNFGIADVVPPAQPQSYKSYAPDENENR